MIKLPNRSFGVELELVGISEWEARDVLEAAGLLVTDDGCKIVPVLDVDGEETGDEDFIEHAAWCVKDDGSLQGQFGECEVVSPKLYGEEGLAEVAKACRALLAAGATVNSTCGLHVHVGAEDLTRDEVLGIFKRYAKHEETIDLVLHKSRRGQYHNYAASIKPTVTALAPGQGYHRLTATKDQLGCLPRYLQVNLSSLRKYGTIEFRHHNGAVKPDTVTAWIRFLLTFVERSRMIVANPDRKIRDDHPWIGLDLATRKFYEARMARARHGGGRMDNYVITWG